MLSKALVAMLVGAAVSATGAVLMLIDVGDKIGSFTSQSRSHVAVDASSVTQPINPTFAYAPNPFVNPRREPSS